MRVVIAEDSVLLREGLAKLLEDEGVELVARAGDAESLLLKVRSYHPDVAIVGRAHAADTRTRAPGQP